MSSAPEKPDISGDLEFSAGIPAGFLMDGTGLLLVVTSYGGELMLTMTSCPEMLPDASFWRSEWRSPSPN
jgi:hypothetical protein